MATGVEDGVVLIHVHVGQFSGAGQHFPGMGVFTEPPGGLGQCIFSLAVRVNRWLAAFRGCEGDVGACVFEYVERRSEFFQPETGFMAGVAHLVVGG